jgi:ABC-type lipoprotein export system ATPase subunit
MITGIDHPTSGTVRVDQAQLHRMNEGQMAVWRGRTLGIVFQFFQLLPTLTILENTLLPMDYSGIFPPEERETRALELLRMLELEEMADKLPAALSGGQQQIAAIARALANDPPIIVADEPTGNLDSRTAEHVLQIFSDLAERGKTILIVTHDPTLARRSTRRVVISDGELVNEWVTQALPMLNHPQMLKITKIAAIRRFEPGTTLARQGAMDAGLFVITQGRVEVLRQQRLRPPEVVGHLQAGDYFSDLEVLETQSCDLTFRAAADNPVETLCLTLGQFSQWLAENPSGESALRHAAIEHSLAFCPGAIPKAERPAQARRNLFGWLRRK